MTPLLRWGNALLKLELFRPRGSAFDRAPPPSGSAEMSGNQALSFARQEATFALRGAVTYEMRAALRMWGAAVVERADPWTPDPSLFARTLGAELLEQLSEAPPLVVCPAADGAVLLGALQALRQRWPRVRGVALIAADTELPDLPRAAELPREIDRVPVGRADAGRARTRVGRELGLLASHAGAAAAVFAHGQGGVAIVSGPGEREFSLEATP
jgi:hypothetical protein